MAEVTVKALKTFRGEKGEGISGTGEFRRGREGLVTSVTRAQAYERQGLTEPISEYPQDDGEDGSRRPQPESVPDTAAKETRLKQERESSGRAGGGTGAGTARLSSRADRQPAVRPRGRRSGR